MKRLYFGTDGVRGLYGSATMNEDFAWRLGCAAGWWLKAATGSAGKVLIGRDTRASGLPLAQAIADGLAYAGSEVFLSLSEPAGVDDTQRVRARRLRSKGPNRPVSCGFEAEAYL